MTGSPAFFPETLKSIPRWVVWKYVERDGKRTKPPYQAASGKLASTTDDRTWATFEVASRRAASARYWEGPGFVFAGADDLMGIDLDHCRDPLTGAIDPEARVVVETMDTYTEITPSGTGLHLIFRATLDMRGRHTEKGEVYQAGRFFTMTGQPLPGYEREPERRQAEVESILAWLCPEPEAPAKGPPARGVGLVGPDWEIIDRVRKNAKYDALWRGDIHGYVSHSEADLALAGHLAFYTGGDAGLVDRLFRQSGLWREKWDAPHGDRTYGEMTVAQALMGKSEFYEWRLPSVVNVVSVVGRNEPTEDASVVSVVSVVGRNHSRKAPVTLEPEALYGLSGEVVAAIDPHTESHPAAVLASFITGMGCLIGRSPHIYRDGGRQTVNEFAVLVGLSATGRKGTATRRAEEILKCLSDGNSTKLTMHDMHESEQESLYESLRLSGLGSGEAMVEALSDKEADRRRTVVEEEFARCLKVMKREGSTLSETIRATFDGGVLANRTKGKQLRAARHHVTILGHITEDELKAEMGDVSIYNGFANRFLWVCCTRTKSLPRGGGKTAMGPLVTKLQAALCFARHLDEVDFSEAVMQAWDEGGIYERLNAEQPGLLGAVTARAAAHVTRLSLFWMCMDLEAEVQPRHMLAALAFWEFSMKSCEYLFGTSTGDAAADRIEEALGEVAPGGLDRTQIRDLFNRNAKAGVIPAALALLRRLGRAESRRMETPGRAAEVWSLQGVTTNDGDDVDDKSPLERAKRLFSGTDDVN